MVECTFYINKDDDKFSRIIKNFFKLINTRTIMKTIIKGMVLLLAGASFVACSKDVSFDENAQKQAEQEAQIAQKFADYKSAFVNHFGAIASGHDWGFDQAKASTTRTSLTSSNEYWFIPDNFLFGEQNKNGVNLGNLIRAYYNNNGNEKAVFSDDLDIDFNSFWLQHIENPGNKNIIKELQAWNSNINDWEKVKNFEKGKNNDDFEIPNTYLYAELNTSSANTTLMTEMGGAAYNNKNDENDPINGKRFRWVEEKKEKGKTSYVYHYNYKFLTYTHTPKFSVTPGEITETFLLVEISSGDYWGIKIAHAAPASKTLKEAGVIFCEDMGDNGDFDFNDVVFNARMYEDNHIDIEVLASGATLDIAIAGTPVNLGAKMANTGVNSGTIQKFTISAQQAASLGITELKQIPIVVTDKGGAEYALTAPNGDVPQKVCAPLGTAWAEEYISIELAYPQFRQYVNSREPNKWTSTYVSKYVDLDLNTK